MALGSALAGKIYDKYYRTYVLLVNGEFNEGRI